MALYRSLGGRGWLLIFWSQRRNARVNRVTFNEGLNILVLAFAAYSSLALLFFICLLGKLTIPRSIQCSKPVHQNLYPSHGRLISISCGFEECNKRSKVSIKSWISSLKLIPLGRNSSTDFCCDYKEDQAIDGV